MMLVLICSFCQRKTQTLSWTSWSFLCTLQLCPPSRCCPAPSLRVLLCSAFVTPTLPSRPRNLPAPFSLPILTETQPHGPSFHSAPTASSKHSLQPCPRVLQLTIGWLLSSVGPQALPQPSPHPAQPPAPSRRSATFTR